MINNKLDFKKENQRAWELNTNYWLHSPLRQVEDTRPFFAQKLKSLVRPEMVVADMGCGSGWLLDSLLELDIELKYVGFDFNAKFINHLQSKYRSVDKASFVYTDLEEDLCEKFKGAFDIVFNCFNFFETANLDTSFANAVRMLKENGQVVIFTIDVTFLILAVSKTMEEFKSKLNIYEEIKSKDEVPYFFQNIDMGDSESKELKYASVLYSLDDFYKQANKFNLTMVDYGEVVKTSKYLPKVYQYIVFKIN